MSQMTMDMFHVFGLKDCYGMSVSQMTMDMFHVFGLKDCYGMSVSQMTMDMFHVQMGHIHGHL
jgi:hypothetical protein